MTLCKYRPQRTYDAQFIFERNDVVGMLRKLDEAIGAMGEAGVASTPYYVGAYVALRTLFVEAEDNGEVDMWADFLAAFEDALEELEGA